MKFWTLLLAAFLVLAGATAEAARLGGGRSIGRQSGNVTQRQTAPAQGAVKSPTPPPAPAAPAPAVPKRPWGAMLGGLAAGLGLAWLASSLGLGGGAIAQFMMLALLALAIVMLIGWFLRSRRAAPTQSSQNTPFAFQGASPASTARTPISYQPENVGNDASARPWERSSSVFDSLRAVPDTSRSLIGSALTGSQNWGIPAGFDTEGFLHSAKANYVSLQAAWDKSDINALRLMMTDTMLKEIQEQLAEREVHAGGPINFTDVVMIEAQLLGIEDLGDDYMASVEFSGMIRDEASAGPNPFREVWNMTKSKSSGSGWLVAGVQALQ